MPKLEAVPDQPGDTWQAPDVVDWLDEVEDKRRYLIKELLPAESFILMSGQQKLTQKTFTALSMLIAIASGKEMSLIRPEEQGNVLAVEEEGSAAETKARILALCTAMKVPYKSLRGKFNWVFRHGVLLNDEKWQLRLLRETERLKPKLIMFDAMFALHTANENDSGEMAPIVHFLKNLTTVSGASVLVLAHLNESSGWNPRADIDRQVRGSGIIPQAVDKHLALRRYDEREKEIKLITRARGAAPNNYTIQWSFETSHDKKGDQKLDAAFISIAPTAEHSPYPTADTFKPEPGKTYTRQFLRGVFGSLPKATAFVEQQLQNGVFKIAGDKKWECVKDA